jgi:CRP-like cAMP-binding protein
VNDVLMRLLAGEVRRLDERLLEALYLPAEKRLRRRLCELAELYGGDNGDAEIPLTQEKLAELAGTSRATVNRVLREEEKRGTLELRRRRTVIRDLEALTRRAR